MGDLSSAEEGPAHQEGVADHQEDLVGSVSLLDHQAGVDLPGEVETQQIKVEVGNLAVTPPQNSKATEARPRPS